MNVERLHAISLAVRADLEATRSVEIMRSLRDSLRNQVNAPEEPSHQQQVSDAVQALADSLSDAASNGFPPTWLQALEELQVDDLLGAALLARVNSIFDRNQITPAIAADSIQTLTEEVEQFETALLQLLGGLSAFGIGSEELASGEAEVGVLVPRAAVGNELDQLGSELVALQRIFDPFLELASGSRPPLIVSTIASSDFAVFVEMAPPAAALVALAAERIISGYKNVLEIRRLRQELRDEGVSDEHLAGIDDHANTHMTDVIDPLVEELVDQGFGNDSGRKNELRTELRLSLNALANRIDIGYNIDVRAADDSPESEDDTPNGEQSALQFIIETSQNLRFINRTGQPVLSLSEDTTDDDAQVDDDASDESDVAPV